MNFEEESNNNCCSLHGMVNLVCCFWCINIYVFIYASRNIHVIYIHIYNGLTYILGNMQMDFEEEINNIFVISMVWLTYVSDVSIFLGKYANEFWRGK